MTDYRVVAARSLVGELAIPGDKSISHRYAILASIADGTSEIDNYSPAADCASTLRCVEGLGVHFNRDSHHVSVRGAGLNGLRAPTATLDAGNSGTTLRLLSGVLAGQRFESVITGDDSLRRRPMGRVVEPLTRMGASIQAEEGKFPPLRIRGGDLKAIRYEAPIPSAQVKSCILLAGLYASGATTVAESVATRDHTELALIEFGAPLDRASGLATIAPPACLSARDLSVPGDISSAVFLIAAALLLPGSQVRLTNVGLNATRTAVLDLFQSMGAPIRITNCRTLAGEPRGDIEVQSATLSGCEISGAASAQMIDELPMLAALGPFTERGVAIRDARELRVKETDRIAAMADNLRQMGARVEPLPDGLIVSGRDGGPLHGAEIDPRGDHRLAMAMAVAGLASAGETVIHDADCVGVSFPGFFGSLETLRTK